MGRRLPSYDPDSDGPWETSKRRLQLFKRLYQNYYLWRSLREAGEVGDIITIEGVDYYSGDLLAGLETLPRQQRRAFELICLNGYTESAATAVMLPGSKWSTPCQQYSDDALRKMVAAYDAVQNGTWKEKLEAFRRVSKKKAATPSVNTAPPKSASQENGEVRC